MSENDDQDGGGTAVHGGYPLEPSDTTRTVPRTAEGGTVRPSYLRSEAVQAASDAGFAMVPVATNKRPKCRWQQWTQRPQTAEEFAGLVDGALWAVVTGELYGIIVLDWDTPTGVTDAERLGVPLHVRTAAGGHTYVQWPGFPVSSKGDKTLPGLPHLDLKGESSLAYFDGRSSKGRYEPVVWPPQPVPFESLPKVVQAAVRSCEQRPYSPPEAGSFQTYDGTGEGRTDAVAWRDRTCTELRDAAAGTSNALLIKGGEGIGGLIAAGLLDESAARKAWRAAAEDRLDSEPSSRADRTIDHGMQKPWADFGVGTFEDEDGAAVEATRLVGNSQAGVRPLTDLGNAERLIDRHGEAIRWVADAGRWVVWRGGRWERDPGAGHVRYLAQETTRGIHEEAARDGLTKAEQREIGGWALASQSGFKLKAMEEQARYRPDVQASRGDFDRHPLLVNFQNGTLGLDTGDFSEHRRNDLLTKILPYPYEPDAGCPVWRGVLERAVPDPEQRAYLQRALGTALIGQIPDRAFFLIYGSPGTGKSIVVEAVAAVVGEYGLKGKPEALIQAGGRGSGPTPELAELEGRRFVYFSETDQHARMAVARLKDMTGSGKVNGRRNREDGGEFPLIATLMMDTNHVPAMGGDQGGWDRVHPVVFSNVVPAGERQDRHELLAALAAEGPGILNWLLDGARDYQRSGLQPPAAALAFREAHRESEDLVAQFVADRCELGNQFKTEPGDVFRDYEDWCKQEGHEGYRDSRTLWKDSALRDFLAVKSNGRRFRQGIRLLPERQQTSGRWEAA